MAMATPTSSPSASHPQHSSPPPFPSPSPSINTTSSSSTIPPHDDDDDDDDANFTQKVYLISISLSIWPTATGLSESNSFSNSLNLDLSRFVGRGMLSASYRFDVPSISTAAARPSTSAAMVPDSITETEAFRNLIEKLKRKIVLLTKTKSNGPSHGREMGRVGSGILLLLSTPHEEGGEEESTLPCSSSSSYTIEKISTELQNDPNRTKEIDISTLIARDHASLILVAKIAGAAAEMGYGFGRVKRLAELVGANTNTVATTGNAQGVRIGILKEEEGIAVAEGISELEEKGKEQQVEEVVRDMLTHLLHHHSHPERGFLRINSNEPVLLLNLNLPSPRSSGPFTGCPSIEQIKFLLSTTLTNLQRDHDIKPVRVYVRDYFPHPATPPSSGFSISLLNVINTDLGGPSMIQLLDCATDVAAWGLRLGLVGKEEWEALLQGGAGWSIDGVVGLVMKNWEWEQNGRVMAEKAGVEAVRDDRDGDWRVMAEKAGVEAVRDDIDGDGKAGRDEDVLVGQQHQQQQHIEIHETGGSGTERDDDTHNSALSGQREEKITPSLEIRSEEAEEAQEESALATPLPEFKPLETEEVEAKSDENEKDDKADENVVANEQKESGDRGMGDVARDAEDVGTTEKGSQASDEDFEMVDPEQTLIDMVFGRGK